ncbi:aspartate aminotransferase [Calothrix sp. NIES-3974]|nr:aspartate aminotransferase [Calothrix sp. NIES-3974]
MGEREASTFEKSDVQSVGMYSSRMSSVQSPIIPVVGELIRSHPGTISLGQGVVSYPPPATAMEMLSQFFAQSQNHLYQPVEGIPRLIEVIGEKLTGFNQIDCRDRHIIVTAGSNMGFVNALLAISTPGDEIILNAPYYFNHEMAVTMASCQPVVVATDANYQLDVEAIRKAITPKTKAIVTISPNNPTGAVYSLESLREINQICRDRSIYHISDETYEYFTYEGAKHVSPAAFTDSHDQTICLYSLSKAYGFASWRIGYMVIPHHLLLAVKKVQDTILICPPVISQYAAIGALSAPPSYLQTNIGAIAQVRKEVLNLLAPLADICKIAPAPGAFYFFLKIHLDIDSWELVKILIQKYQVAVIPGNTFGMEQGCYLRVAYGALQAETACEGITRLVRGLRDIAK